MANPEHVDIVRQGAEAIEEWRKENRDERLNLSRADLSGAELMAANLRDANLTGAKLVSADLEFAFLRFANLRSTNLANANLTVATLESADLREAYLISVNLSGASVAFANFKGAIFSHTILGDVNLTHVRGLEGIDHKGPSVIDERTLRKSWPLPEVFLRGCGVSDELIEFARATYGKAIEFYSCFVSYSSNDEAFAKRLHADLQVKGVRCWFAPEDLRIGDRFRARMYDAIRTYDKLLLILSKDSVQSEWVESEVEAAFERERGKKKRTVLFPIRIDGTIQRSRKAWAAEIRRTRHIGDFTDWRDHDAYQKSFERLLRDLKSDGKPGPED